VFVRPAKRSSVSIFCRISFSLLFITLHSLLVKSKVAAAFPDCDDLTLSLISSTDGKIQTHFILDNVTSITYALQSADGLMAIAAQANSIGSQISKT
jgi:hypothetical protein